MNIKKFADIFDKHHAKFTALVISCFFFIFSKYSILRHQNFNSDAFDLGIYTQIAYLYSQALLPFSTLKHMPLLADHFEPILWLLSPAYWIYSGAETLLIIQALFVSLSAVLLYLIAKAKTENKLLSLVIITAYLTSVGIVNAVKYDFHTTTIAVLPISLVLYSWIAKKYYLYWSALLISFLFKEDIPILMAGLGLYQALSGQKKLGLSTLAISVSAFLLIKFAIMPFIWNSTGSSYLSLSILPLQNPIDLLFLFFTNPKIGIDIFFNSPIKMNTVTALHQPFGFLSLLSPLSWLTTLPMLFFRFSTTHQLMWSTLFHYNANLMPFITVSTLLSITKWKLPHIPIMLLLTLLLIIGGLSPNSIVWEALQLKRISSHHYKNEMIHSLPKNESISAQSKLLPHLANRPKIYLFPEVLDANYIILDTNLESYPIDKKTLNEEINRYKSSPNWQIHSQKESIIIFERIHKIEN